MAFVLRSIENQKNLNTSMEEKKAKAIILEKNMKIFVDIKSFRGKLELLDSNLQKLKVKREEFLTKDVNYIVCGKNHQNADTSISASQGMLRVPALSRGHTLLQRSNSTSTVNNLTDPLKFAVTWKIPVVTHEELMCHIKAVLLSKEKKRTNLRNRGIIRRFKGVYVKFEDAKKRCAPVFKCFDYFPVVSFLKKDFAKSLITDERNLFDFEYKKNEGNKCVDGTKNNDEKKGDRFALKKDKNDRMNYCECCEKLFEEEVLLHLSSSLHKRFVRQTENFNSLDKIIGTLPSIDSLNSILPLDLSQLDAKSENLKYDEISPCSVLLERISNDSLEKMQNPFVQNKDDILDLRTSGEHFLSVRKESHKSPSIFNDFISPTMVLSELYRPRFNKQQLLIDSCEKSFEKDKVNYSLNLLNKMNSLQSTKNKNFLNSCKLSSTPMLPNDSVCTEFINKKLAKAETIDANMGTLNVPNCHLRNNIKIDLETSPPILEPIVSNLQIEIPNTANTPVHESPPILFHFNDKLTTSQLIETSSCTIDKDIKNNNQDFVTLDMPSPVNLSKILNNVSMLLNQSNDEIFKEMPKLASSHYDQLEEDDSLRVSFETNDNTSPYDYKNNSIQTSSRLEQLTYQNYIGNTHSSTCHLNKFYGFDSNDLMPQLLDYSHVFDDEDIHNYNNYGKENVLLNDMSATFNSNSKPLGMHNKINTLAMNTTPLCSIVLNKTNINFVEASYSKLKYCLDNLDSFELEKNEINFKNIDCVVSNNLNNNPYKKSDISTTTLNNNPINQCIFEERSKSLLKRGLINDRPDQNAVNTDKLNGSFDSDKFNCTKALVQFNDIHVQSVDSNSDPAQLGLEAAGDFKESGVQSCNCDLASAKRMELEAIIDVSEEKLKKMNETIKALWSATYITDLKIKLSKVSK